MQIYNVGVRNHSRHIPYIVFSKTFISIVVKIWIKISFWERKYMYFFKIKFFTKCKKKGNKFTSLSIDSVVNISKLVSNIK